MITLETIKGYLKGCGYLPNFCEAVSASDAIGWWICQRTNRDAVKTFALVERQTKDL